MTHLYYVCYFKPREINRVYNWEFYVGDRAQKGTAFKIVIHNISLSHLNTCAMLRGTLATDRVD